MKQFDAVGGLVMLRENPSWIEKNWILNSSRTIKFQNTFSGASIFINRDIFKAIGGFDPTLNAWEDSKLSHDLIDQGYSIDINPKLNVTHLGFPTTNFEFLSRQKWQASDYAFKLNQVFNDMILLLVVIFLICTSLLVYGVFSGNIPLIIGVFTCWLILPGLLTVKSITRYGGLQKHHSILSIFVVGIMYLFGRTLGLIGGFARFFSGRNKKIYKPRV